MVEGHDPSDDPERGARRQAEEAADSSDAATVTVFCRLVAKPQQRPQLVEALQPFLEYADDEPRTVTFTLYESTEDPNLVHLHEAYRDEQAFAAHRDNPMTQSLREGDKLTGGAGLAKLLAEAPHNTFLRTGRVKRTV